MPLNFTFNTFEKYGVDVQMKCYVLGKNEHCKIDNVTKSSKMFKDSSPNKVVNDMLLYFKRRLVLGLYLCL
jgi:hypothetical protein